MFDYVYVYKEYEFNCHMFYCLYIKCPEIESTMMFSSFEEVHKKLNEYKNLNLKFDA